MKKNEIYTGKVDRYEFPNKGYVNEDGIKIMVKNAILGQTVSYRLRKKRNNGGEGRLVSVVEDSYLETGAQFCENYGSCGSCLYQKMTYENQLELKKNLVTGLLDGVCGGYEFDGIKESPERVGYRNKMEYSFGDEQKGGLMVLGLHKRGSYYDVVDASRCMIAPGDFGKIVRCVTEYCRGEGLDYYHKSTHEGYLRHLLLRRSAADKGILACIVTTSQREHDFAGLVSRMRELELDGSITGILHTFNDSVADTIKDEHTDILYGQDYITEDILGLKFRISPFSFFQTNSAGAGVLYQTVRDYIKDAAGGKVVFDLYSGTGTIAQLLAPVARRVVGVEIAGEAVAAARANAAANGIGNCGFITGDVLKALDEIEERPDVIILDPPRDGVHPKALRKILDYGAEDIVYISCKPTSLARDLGVMREAGYEVKRARAVDMFPWTVHVETVVLMSRVRD